MSIDPLREWFDSLEAPREERPASTLWAAEAFNRLEAGTLLEGSGAAEWARESSSMLRPARLAAPAPSGSSRWPLVASNLGAALAAAAGVLLVLLVDGGPAGGESTPDVALPQVELRRPAEQARATSPAPSAVADGAPRNPDLHLRSDGVELRSGSVRLLILDSSNRSLR